MNRLHLEVKRSEVTAKLFLAQAIPIDGSSSKGI